MIATPLSALAFLACLASLGIGVAATLVGAVVAVLADPGEQPFVISPQVGGVMSALLGLLVFLASPTLLARSLV
jgi:hypothetical protein